MDLRHALHQLPRQVPTAETYIKKSGLNALMAGELGDLMDIPVGSREVCQTEMAWRMRGELSDAAALRNVLHNLRPCPNRKGSATVTA